MKKFNSVGATQYKAFSLLSMLYITIILSADVLIYKIASLGPITITVGSFVVPFWFVITDIIAEVYGYQLTRKLICGVTRDMLMSYLPAFAGAGVACILAAMAVLTVRARPAEGRVAAAE